MISIYLPDNNPNNKAVNVPKLIVWNSTASVLQKGSYATKTVYVCAATTNLAMKRK